MKIPAEPCKSCCLEDICKYEAAMVEIVHEIESKYKLPIIISCKHYRDKWKEFEND